MASISAYTRKTSAGQATRSLSIGTLDDRILAHRFFHVVDARHWHQVETFHNYRDTSLSAQRHADIYKADLERISVHDGVPEPLRKTALNLAKHFKNDEFVDKFLKITDKVGERRANNGVRSLLFGVTENVGTPPGKSICVAPNTAGRHGSKRSSAEAGELGSTQSPSGKSAVSPFVPMSVHPAGAKRKDFDADDVYQAREKTQRTPASQKAQLVGPEEPPIPDPPSELSLGSLTPSYLDDTEEADDMCSDNPLEDIGPASDTKAVDDVGRAADSEALDDVDVGASGYAYPITTLKDLEREPGPTFGPKWLLESGTVVEDVLLQAGLELSVDHPIRSFMVDLQDKYTESLFSPQDWTEIKSNLPVSVTYSTKAAEYLDTLEDIVQEQDIISALDSRPCDPEMAIVHRCAESWCDMYGMDPSPFVLESVLSEDWWVNNAWSGTRLLAKAVPGSYIITGEVTGIDSTSRRNNKERYVNIVPQNNRKKMGVRADMIWRTLEAPMRDWMIGEAARQWDENAGKYVRESTFKVPRQLHDILSARTLEVGGAHRLRNVWITGMVFGGPVVQRVSLCWGAQGTNVTRFKRWTPARIYPSLKQLSLSLNAARQLLLVRAETLRLIDEYNRAEQEERKEKRARASRHHDTEDDWGDEEEWRDLLNSSP
ncbi:hypothetical protein EDD11_007116 [Mortierella claussenii]|nr:hypothetical protein EDD11_007116 [Mortierella claussenii]